MSDRVLSYTDTADIESLLVGRRVVAVEFIPDDDDHDGWYDRRTGVLTLDDGTTVTVHPNEGCGGCTEGWYSITNLAAVDNVITSVRAVEETDARFQIFVVADATEINLLTVEGHDNGYYGVGYTLTVSTGDQS